MCISRDVQIKFISAFVQENALLSACPCKVLLLLKKMFISVAFQVKFTLLLNRQMLIYLDVPVQYSSAFVKENIHFCTSSGKSSFLLFLFKKMFISRDVQIKFISVFVKENANSSGYTDKVHFCFC
jgi:hypothetical protein